MAGMPMMGPGMMPQMPFMAAPMWAMPAAPAAAPAPAAPAAPPAPPPVDYERKIALLERRLQDEREKVLLASLKSKEESEIASRVEVSIKDVQDKLRRDRREGEMEETRLKLEARVQELEARLGQERETWVHTLKGQMSQREAQDRDIEGQFTHRIQEIERRWLEEKAHWQRLIHAREDELRQAKGAAESLKGIELEFRKLDVDKKSVDEKLARLVQENAALQAKTQGAEEREREFYRVKAELEKSQDQLHVLHERLERELQVERAGSKEREQRLLEDNEKLQNELMSLAQRLRADYESEIRRVKSESEGETKKAKAQADLAGAALQRMRAVAGAMEKQLAALRVQAGEAQKLKDEVLHLNERYKAEFLVLQRRWQDRELELRKSAEVEAAKRFDAEKSRLKLRAQEELQAQVVRVQGEARTEMERELADRQSRLRAAMEEEIARRLKLEAEKAAQQSQGADQARRRLEEELHASRQELAKLQQSHDEMRGRSALDEEWRSAHARERGEQEKALIALREQVRRLETVAGEAQARAAAEERRFAALCAERDNWNRLKIAYEVKDRKNAQDLEALKAGNARLQAQLEECRRGPGAGGGKP